MTIKNLLLAVASLVEARSTIDHGSIRCLWWEDGVRAIAQCEGIDADEVGTGTVGDDALAERIRELAEEPHGIEIDELIRLDRAMLGESIEDYLDVAKEDELHQLDALINRARELFA